MSDVWYPPLSPKGADIVNDTHRFLLVHGPRKTGKTCALCIKLAKHLYETPHARAAVVVHRNQTGKNGTWDDLTNFVITQHYQEHGGVLPYLRAPSYASDTKTSSFVVKNAFGGKGICTMYGLYNQKDAERIFKTTRFSFIYVTEADLFVDGGIFRVMVDQLRVLGLPFEKHQMVLDCNPPVAGTDHWLYNLFFDHTDKSPAYAKQFREVQMMFDDNPFLSPAEKMELVAGYAHDRQKFERLINGKWIRSTAGALYENVFDIQRHVIGVPEPGQKADDIPVLVPPEGSSELVCGWDLGRGVNHAWVLMCRRSVGYGRAAFDVLDEVISVAVEASLEDVVGRIIKRMEYWEDILHRRGAEIISYRHWSDDSAFNYIASANATEARIVQRLSEGKIQLRAAPKGPNSVADRVAIIRRLLADDNLYISARCHQLIESLSTMRVKTMSNTRESTLRAADPRKHAFDAMSYAISAESPRLSMAEMMPSQTPRRLMATVRL